MPRSNQNRPRQAALRKRLRLPTHFDVLALKLRAQRRPAELGLPLPSIPANRPDSSRFDQTHHLSPSNASTFRIVRRRFANTKQLTSVGSAPRSLRTVTNSPSNERRHQENVPGASPSASQNSRWPWPLRSKGTMIARRSGRVRRTAGSFSLCSLDGGSSVMERPSKPEVQPGQALLNGPTHATSALGSFLYPL